MKVATESIEAITAKVQQEPGFRGYSATDVEFMLNRILEGHESCPGKLFWSWGDNMGARSVLRFKCDTCKYNRNCWTSRPNPTFNKSIVLATITTGLTYAQVAQLFGIIGMQFMSKETFFRLEEELTAPINELLEEVLAENNAMEYALCAPIPDTDIRETTVGFDMMWGQHNNGKYDGDSGIGVTVGLKADLPVHAQVFNKRCTICERYANKNEEPPEHNCYQNWERSSGAMESAAAVIACQTSEKYKLQYTTMVTDSDASIEAALREAQVYREKQIQHLHCCIHIYRGVKSKFRSR
jgi:hypothetical protein